jgi:hypothetical protein
LLELHLKEAVFHFEFLDLLPVAVEFFSQVLDLNDKLGPFDLCESLLFFFKQFDIRLSFIEFSFFLPEFVRKFGDFGVFEFELVLLSFELFQEILF